VRVAFQLRRREETAETAALLLLAHEIGDLVRLYSDLRIDPLPPAHRTCDGFVVKPPPATSPALGGAIRLQALAENFFIPVDAELIPALLREELTDLVRERGLVVLPGGRALSFDPAQAVAPRELLTGAVQRHRWQPLPEPSPLADRLMEISLEAKDLPPDELLEAGGEGIGTEDPEPENTKLAARALGRGAFGAGKALAWLGKIFGVRGLARTGVKWMQAGMDMAPRMAESALGKQEAALRELLKAFQRGDIERALRRALPLGEGGRGSGFSTAARLPLHNLIYSLRNLLGDAGAPGGYWLTSDNLYHELVKAYRKQAELASQRGDHRRTAFIYGKLLRDFRAAAAALSRGGLHHDAAILYLKRLDDPMAAAREFEAAGEIDRALALYQHLHDHLAAGDLLRRAGEPERALAAYKVAAKQAAHARGSHYEAGEIMRTHAGRLDLAMPYYESGWASRPSDNPLQCAIRLAQAFGEQGDLDRLFALTAEANTYFGPPGNDDAAAAFYNDLARLAGRLHSTKHQEDLRDCALMGIAAKLRQRAAHGTATLELASSMLGVSKAWAPEVVNDARAALSGARKRHRRTDAWAAADRVVLPARIPVVTAVCQAADSGDLFVGFESGEVVSFRPRISEVTQVVDIHRPVLALASAPRGEAVTVFSERVAAINMLALTRERRPDFVATGSWMFQAADDPMLCPFMSWDEFSWRAGVWTDTAVELIEGPLPHLVDRWTFPRKKPLACFLLPLRPQFLLAFYTDGLIARTATGEMQGTNKNRVRADAGLRIGSLRHSVTNWLTTRSGQVKLVGVAQEGCIWVSEVHHDDERLSVATATAHVSVPALGAAPQSPSVVAAVLPGSVAWFRHTSNGLEQIGTKQVRMQSPLACFASSHGRELLIVCQDGTVIRVLTSWVGSS
jgi:tetratricopeptide (TPR) repeat protein